MRLKGTFTLADGTKVDSEPPSAAIDRPERFSRGTNRTGFRPRRVPGRGNLAIRFPRLTNRTNFWSLGRAAVRDPCRLVILGNRADAFRAPLSVRGPKPLPIGHPGEPSGLVARFAGMSRLPRA